MPARVYEAMLSRADSLVLMQRAKRAIERAGGSIKLGPPSGSGMVLVTLILPDQYTPKDFVPGLPFYPV
jgi:hypothetical protein